MFNILKNLFHKANKYEQAKAIINNLADGQATWCPPKIAEILEDSDIDVIGAGAYGIVIDLGKTVVKFFEATDWGYLAFLDIAQAYSSPYLPKINWVERINEKIIAVSLEKLKPYDVLSDPDYYDIRRTIEWGCPHSDFELIELGHIMREHRDGILSLVYRSLIDDEYINIHPDLHSANVMIRGDTQFVITDPWCS